MVNFRKAAIATLVTGLVSVSAFAITADEINKLTPEQVNGLSDAQMKEYASISPDFARKLSTVTDTKLSYLGAGIGEPLAVEKQKFTLDDVNQTVGALDNIVNLANKIWEIIKANAPTADAKINYASAVPKGIEHWSQLAGWSEPTTQKYQITYRNIYGGRVFDFVFMVNYTYNGNYDGKGHYLTGVTVIPVDLYAIWGCKVNVNVEVPDSTVVNVGTKDNPIAAMQVVMKYEVNNNFQLDSKSVVFYVRGDGSCKEMTGFATQPKSLNSLKSIGGIHIPQPNIPPSKE